MDNSKNLDKETLKQKIAEQSGGITASIKRELGELETEYIKARKEQKVGIFLIVLAFVMPIVLEFILMLIIKSLFILVETLNLLGAYVFLGNIIYLVDSFIWILILFFIYKGINLFFRNLAVIKRYHNSVNRVIFSKMFALLGLSGRLVDISPVKNEAVETFSTFNTNTWRLTKVLRELKGDDSLEGIGVLADLDSSELITQNHNTNRVDNVFEINYQNSTIRIAELDIEHVTGSGKSRHTEQIFHGYFVCFDLKRELAAKTFVSAEVDKHGFGNLSIFNKNAGEARETMLEWNEFENLLHVATTDEVEARYILTPNFMHDLYEWWQGRETNIRLSFIKNRLYILYPDDKIRLNQTVEKITDETIVEYIYTISWPLQNVIKLIDDVRL